MCDLSDFSIIMINHLLLLYIRTLFYQIMKIYFINEILFDKSKMIKRILKLNHSNINVAFKKCT